MKLRFPYLGFGQRFAKQWPALLVALGMLPPAWAQAPTVPRTGPLRVCVVSAGPVEEGRQALSAALQQALGPDAAVTGAAADGVSLPGALREADAAVFNGGPGRIEGVGATALRDFLQSGRGIVALGATREGWAAVPGFIPEQLGAEPGEKFADGAPMSVINLFPHPIYTGVVRFETRQPMAAWKKLADDAQLIMEGTVGEATTPLAWVRRRANGRVCHIVPAGATFWRDEGYVRMVANAVRWTSGRPIPGAQPIVQRTFMPESYPGSFAVTFPTGPGVCFDPVRGGINFVWDGDFVDLRPRWLTKQGESPRIFGQVFYQEKEWQPLRAGAADRDPEYHFRGYALTAAGPEFHYQIGGRDVFETLAATADGAGVTRRFRVGAGTSPLWINLEPQSAADVSVRGLERDGRRAAYTSTAAGEFVIEIHRKSAISLP